MFLVTMEAHVAEEQWDTLRRAFDHAMKYRPDDIVLSMLVQDNVAPSLWRVLTVWESQEKLEAYYTTHDRMPSAYVFHLVGVVPTATMGAVSAYAGPVSGPAV